MLESNNVTEGSSLFAGLELTPEVRRLFGQDFGFYSTDELIETAKTED